MLTHTSHRCSVHTKYHTLYLLRTYRTTDNPCHTHSIHAFKNIQRLCHTQYSLYIHTGTSPHQTAAGRHNYIDTMPCHGTAHNVTSLLQHKHTIPEAQITADTHRVIALRSCPVVYLLSTHIPGHTLAYGTCIRIQHSAQTQHPVHPHGDTPSLPCAPTRPGFSSRLYKGHYTPPSFPSRLTHPYKHTIPPVLSRRTTHLTRVTRQAEPCHGCSGITREEEEEEARRPSHLTTDTQACATAGTARPHLPWAGTQTDRGADRHSLLPSSTAWVGAAPRPGPASARPAPRAPPPATLASG